MYLKKIIEIWINSPKFKSLKKNVKKYLHLDDTIVFAYVILFISVDKYNNRSFFHN